MASRDKYSYFIITATPKDFSWIKAGNICHVKANHYTEFQKSVSVKCIDGCVNIQLPLDILHPLTCQKAEFLLALDSFKERLDAIAHPEILEQAVELTVGSEVIVEQKDKWLNGVVRYIGPRTEAKLLDPIGGVFFGVELQVSSNLLCYYK